MELLIALGILQDPVAGPPSRWGGQFSGPRCIHTNALEICDFCNGFNQLCSPGSVSDLINLPVSRLYRPSATAGGRKAGKMET